MQLHFPIYKNSASQVIIIVVIVAIVVVIVALSLLSLSTMKLDYIIVRLRQVHSSSLMIILKPQYAYLTAIYSLKPKVWATSK